MKKILIALGIIIILGAGYYFVSPLFNNVEVNDELPVATPTQNENAVVESGFENLSLEQQQEMTAQMEEANMEDAKEMQDSTPIETVAQESARFPVMGTFGHPAEGTVRVVNTGSEQVIRFEDFETINGPQLNLYLAKDLDANEFIDLGPIRGTKGNINYTVPEGVDLSEYKYVMHWCVPFSVLFNYAPLQ